MSVGLRLFLGGAQLGIGLFKPNIDIAVGGELGKKKKRFYLLVKLNLRYD